MMQLTDRAFHSMAAAIAANPAEPGSDTFRKKVPTEKILVGDPIPMTGTFNIETYQVRYSGDDCLYRWVRVS